MTEVAGAVARVRTLPEADRLRWTEPAGWHLVLSFYGEVPETAVPGLRTRLARAARRHPPHGLRLVGGGQFGDRTLWVGVAGDRAALRRLAWAAAAAGRRAGAPAGEERRPYHPHLTVARNPAGVPLARYAAGLADFAGSPWPVTELRLLRSHLPTSGVAGEQPRYETLSAWPLGWAPAH